MAAIGETLAGRYRLESVLGAGGTATVYRCWDLRLERPVAVKVLAPNLAARPDVAARFEAEARHLAGTSHPGVVAIFDVGEANHEPYFVMELVEGESLETRLEREGSLAPEVLVPIVASIADGLAALHARGIVHRDVKPLNVLLPRSGRARLADFGLARTDATTHVTSPGMAVGTLAYMAPESLRGEPATAASDVFALGVTTYRGLTGSLPYPARTVAELVEAHASPPPFASAVQPGLGSAFDDLLARALGPAGGRPTAAGFAHDLLGGGRPGSRMPPVVGATASADAPTAAVPRRSGSGLPARPGRAVVVAGLGALGLLALVAALVALGGPLGPGSSRPPAGASGALAGSPADPSPGTGAPPASALPATAAPPATPPPATPPAGGPPEAGARVARAADRYEIALDAAMADETLDDSDARKLYDTLARLRAALAGDDVAAVRDEAEELVDRTAKAVGDGDGDDDDDGDQGGPAPSRLVARAEAVRDAASELGR